MVRISDLLSYLPSQHGEHGVDATLHVLAMQPGPLQVVFSNPPGGSWTQFDIIQPGTGRRYRWDHIPRAPSSAAKRPDLVLQLNEGDMMHLLSIESKKARSDIETGIGGRLAKYFTGTQTFTGLRQRPAWHCSEGDSDTWKFIAPTEPDSQRYWFRDYPDDLIRFWSGFAYALSPEIYEAEADVNHPRINSHLSQMLRDHPALHAVIAVGWVGAFHDPFVRGAHSSEFASAAISDALKEQLAPCLLQ